MGRGVSSGGHVGRGPEEEKEGWGVCAFHINFKSNFSVYHIEFLRTIFVPAILKPPP